MINRILSILALIILIASCKSDPLADMQKTELMSYGFPIAVHAPAGAEFVKGDLGVMQDLTIKAGDNYYVQILGSDATTLDAKEVLQNQMSQAKAHPFFSKIIMEEDNGFIFEKNTDGRINYDFRYIKLQGEKEYIFQTGLVGNFTQDDVKAMYASVK